MITTMRAAVYTEFGEPEVLHIAEVATPRLGERELLVRVRAAGISAEDPKQRRADFPAELGFLYRLIFGFKRPRKPVLGFELAGVVERVGARVASFEIGDEVYATTGARLGSYAEYVSIAENAVVAHKPRGLSFEDAASIPNGALTALVYLRNLGQLQRGESVLVIGAAGAVGSAAVQLARHFGAEVVGVCGARNADLVRELGADRVIDYATQDFHLDTREFDVVFDTVGVTTLRRVKPLLTKSGRLLMTVFGPRDMAQMVWGTVTRRALVRGGASNFFWKRRDLAFITELIEAGEFRATVDRVFPLDDVAQAHRYVESAQKSGAVVLSVAP